MLVLCEDYQQQSMCHFPSHCFPRAAHWTSRLLCFCIMASEAAIFHLRFKTRTQIAPFQCHVCSFGPNALMNILGYCISRPQPHFTISWNCLVWTILAICSFQILTLWTISIVGGSSQHSPDQVQKGSAWAGGGWRACWHCRVPG